MFTTFILGLLPILTMFIPFLHSLIDWKRLNPSWIVRLYLYSFIIFALLIVFLKSDYSENTHYHKNTFSTNFIIELLGIALSIFIIDTTYAGISDFENKRYGKLAKITIAPLIMRYYRWWIFLYEQSIINDKIKIEAKSFDSLEDFFESEVFYKSIITLDFNAQYGQDSTRFDYIYPRIEKVRGDIFEIYSSFSNNLSFEESKLILSLTKNSNVLSIFQVMNLIKDFGSSQNNFRNPYDSTDTHLESQNKFTIRPRMNHFDKIDINNFKSHFKKVRTLSEKINKSIEFHDQKITLDNIVRTWTLSAKGKDDQFDW